MNNRAALSDYAASLSTTEAEIAALNKTRNAQRLADVEQHVKDGLITQREADRKVREIMSE
ncbi:MAG: hypothetical protein SV862_00100 [Pseudomonadota bacterium]|nr:hypothetical protein [Pseudomonadota bacterium]